MRVLAYVIDALLMSAIFFPLGFALGLVMAASGSNQNSPEMVFARMLVNVVSIAAGWLYNALLESSSWQGTVGKKLLGLRVTDLDGQRIGFGRATGRYFGKILSGIICFVGFVMVAFTEKQQGLHDMMAGTLVLSGGTGGEPYREPPPPPDFGYRGGGTPGIG
jgi:uncharacterized RDD family membrane protein YckC